MPLLSRSLLRFPPPFPPPCLLSSSCFFSLPLPTLTALTDSFSLARFSPLSPPPCPLPSLSRGSLPPGSFALSSPPDATSSLSDPGALPYGRPSPLTSFLRRRHHYHHLLSSSSSSHSYSCSGNSLPPARRRTLLHFLRAFSPPRGSSNTLLLPSAISFSSFSLSLSFPLQPLLRLSCSTLRVLRLPTPRISRQPPTPFYYRVASNNSRTYRAIPAGVLYLLPAFARVCK